MAGRTMYERVGGDAFFERLTADFYSSVRTDGILSRMYPGDDPELEAARVRLRDFLIQFWGGPATYSEQHGHPRLRMRHAPFAIGTAERDAWATHMVAAVRRSGLSPMDETQMVAYFESSATAMINQPT